MLLFPKVFRNCLGICISSAAIVTFLAGVSVADVTSGTAPGKHAGEAIIVSGQVTTEQLAQPDRVSADYVKGYFSDSGRMLASPVSWSGEDWLKAGLVIGATTGLYFADTDIRNFAQKNQSSIGDKGAAIGNAIGNPLLAAPSLGLFYLYGHLGEDPKARRTSLLAAESLVISGTVTVLLKQSTRRARPSTGEASTTWNGPGLKPGDHSFPSMHTQTAFSIASVFAEEYGSNRYVPPLAYGLATLTGLARIYDNKHWASDVVFGGAIGYFVGKAVVGYHTDKGVSPVVIVPTISQQGGYGLLAACRF